MADDETPETTEEETTPAAEAAPEEAAPTEEPAAADVEAEEDRPAGDVNPPAPALSKAETRAAAKQAAASQRPARTPEERQAQRVEERKRKAAQRRRRRVKEREKAKSATAAKPSEPEIAVHAATTGRPKERVGRVVSDKADQTITVRIDSARRHRRYEKIVRSSSTLHAHDSSNDANEGDLVRVVESRPLSKTKRWRLLEVLERAR
jgi:small subunit ribosomal protein S17